MRWYHAVQRGMKNGWSHANENPHPGKTFPGCLSCSVDGDPVASARPLRRANGRAEGNTSEAERDRPHARDRPRLAARSALEESPVLRPGSTRTPQRPPPAEEVFPGVEEGVFPGFCATLRAVDLRDPGTS